MKNITHIKCWDYADYKIIVSSFIFFLYTYCLAENAG